jgi:alcohol dehydrogenase class IV
MILQQAYIDKDFKQHLSNILEEKNPAEILLVRGKNSFELSGAKDIFKSVTSPLKCCVTEFFDFSENPKIEDVHEGLKILNRTSTDLIIGTGGGSVIDMAKLIRFFHSYSGEIQNSLFKQKTPLIPLIAVPTTAGTGSEATHFAVVYKDKIKYSVAHEDVLPDIALVYSPFTYSNSKYLTACSGFDALAQAIEAYWNVNATDESDIYAIKAIELLWTNLPVAVNSPTTVSRDKISEGAYWAGKAINITKTTAPHAMSYAFTSYYGFPHGHAVALTFPYFMEYNTHVPREEFNSQGSYECFQMKISKLYEILSLKKSDNVCDKLKTYTKLLGLTFPLPLDFDTEVIADNVNLQRACNNPRILTKESIEAAIKSIKYLML